MLSMAERRFKKPPLLSSQSISYVSVFSEESQSENTALKGITWDFAGTHDVSEQISRISLFYANLVSLFVEWHGFSRPAFVRLLTEYLQAYLKTDRTAEKRGCALLILQPLIPSLLKVSLLKGTHKIPQHHSPDYSVWEFFSILHRFIFWILCSSPE